MSKVKMLRAFVNQRLSAAAEEIFGLFVRTIAEYEEELCCSKENHRQQKVLEAVLNPAVRLHRADIQQLSVVKEEQEELWTSQEGEQLQGLEEADIKFPFTSVPVKKMKRKLSPHSFMKAKLRRTERTGADGEDWGGPEPARNSDPDSPLQPATHDKTSDSSESETDDSGDWEETREPQSGLNPLKNNEVAVGDVECNTGNTSVSSSECAGRFGHKKHLQKHSGVQTGGKTFSCSVCSKRFLLKETLTAHMRLHSHVKCFTCSVCEASFSFSSNLDRHMTINTGETIQLLSL